MGAGSSYIDTFSTPSRKAGSVRLNEEKLTQSASRYDNRAAAAASAVSAMGEQWERHQYSKTNTCICLSAGNYYRPPTDKTRSASIAGGGGTATQALSRSSSNNAMGLGQSSGSRKGIAPLILTWRGAEPLDKLHIAMRVRVR
jgi:hypothetical protein